MNDAVPCTPLGTKAKGILEACALPMSSDARIHRWAALNAQYSAKAVRRKAHELVQRGYLERVPAAVGPIEQSWLTPKGRQTLELALMGG